MLLENGLMLAIVTAESRPAPTTTEDRAAAFNTVIAYSGRYTVQDGQLCTDVDISWNEAWTGTVQCRSYASVGPRLHLTSAWAPSPFGAGRAAFSPVRQGAMSRVTAGQAVTAHAMKGLHSTLALGEQGEHDSRLC